MRFVNSILDKLGAGSENLEAKQMKEHNDKLKLQKMNAEKQVAHMKMLVARMQKQLVEKEPVVKAAQKQRP